MAQEREPRDSTGTYEEMLREQAGELNSLKLLAGNPSLRTIEKRAAALFADEKASLPPATLHALFSGTKYAGREKLLWLVRTLMSWDRYGRDRTPPANGDPELDAWHERWMAITRAKPSRRPSRPTPDPIAGDIESLLRRARVERNAGALEEAEDRFRTALDLAIEHRSRVQEGWAWDGLGSCHWRGGDREMALKFFTRADRIADETGDKLLKAWSLYNFGVYWRRRPEPEAAKDFLERALAVADSHRYYEAAGWTHHELAELARDQKDAHREREHYEAAVRAGQMSQDDTLTGWSLIHLAKCAERAGEFPQAAEHYTLALKAGTRLHHQDMIRRAEEALARIVGSP